MSNAQIPSHTIVDERSARWRPEPKQLGRLLAGLAVFGTGEALVIASHLGNAPWSVLAAGVGRSLGTSIGIATIMLSLVVLLAWMPLRQVVGCGTIANALLVGVAIDAALDVLPQPAGILWRYGALLAGIGLAGVGTALYLGASLGAGPRDGLMLGLHERAGVSIRLARTMIEIIVVAVGAVLGGRAGIGTIMFALLVGPSVQVAMSVLRVEHDRPGRSEPIAR